MHTERADTQLIEPGATLRVPEVRLRVASGPDAGLQLRVDAPTFIVGTGERADLRLTDATVSRSHLRLSRSEAGVRVRDEGSRNGTWIGGVRVVDVVATGDTVLTLGTTTMAVHLEAGVELPVSSAESFGAAIGFSPAMRHVFASLERAASSDVTVLLEGESGVGKEVLARGVHAQSARHAGPLVTVDCGAISPTLIESELFGHERGAFTGATHARRGLFEEARGGTLFLDEIGELPLELQPKLLRVLEGREIRAVGANVATPIDVRILAATNRNLAQAVERGEFRRDLYYRLAVARIAIPPLRDRVEDILPLARAFLRRALDDPRAILPADLAAMLTSYSWPGNVRELRNVVDRYALFGAREANGLFDSEHPTLIPPPPDDLSDLPFHEARRIALDRFERAYVPRVLERAGGVVARAALLAEVARPSFYRMLDRLAGASSRDSNAEH